MIAPPAVLQAVTIQTQGSGKHKVKVIVLQFSGAVNASAAGNLGSYMLATVAAKKHPSKGVALALASYNAATHQVTLRTRKALVLTTPLHLAVNVTSHSFLATLGKGGTGISSAVAIESKAVHVESVGSHFHHARRPGCFHAGFRPKFLHLSQ